ncbi:hypothetical protein B0H16DRAFT_1560803 [Mycena metata]|uniref:Uncharacterized protein n=1 Tax=Mycena metata TaxID=1033252 RepID=A0AAD7N2S4_9AGAR|nr:hypothetical protein B0H16DRAFT_1560803 [Mycena metata]
MNLAKARAFLGRNTLHNVPFRGIHRSPTFMTSFRFGDTTFERRPWRFWDMHLPTTTWVPGWGAIKRDPSRNRQNQALPAGLCNIPDTHLPSPWTCNWSRCNTWERKSTLDVFIKELRHHYNIPGVLNPIMFQDTWYSPTVLESRGTFYLFEKVLGDSDPLYKFPGTYISVEDFLENCDWNEMVQMQPAKSLEPLVQDIVSPEKLPLTHSERGLRLASAEPYRKRTLLDVTRPEGVWSFEPRKHWLNRHNDPAPAQTDSWPQIPDSQLPEPFSCAWHAFHPLEYQEWEADLQQELLHRWGVADLVPVMFLAESNFDTAFYIPIVLRTGHTYYLWIWLEDPEAYVVAPTLRKFEGTYTVVEDFVQNADWNRMHKLELDGDGEPWEGYDEEMYRRNL